MNVDRRLFELRSKRRQKEKDAFWAGANKKMTKEDFNIYLDNRAKLNRTLKEFGEKEA